jgi:uncharacterized protein (DUF305 family)
MKSLIALAAAVPAALLLSSCSSPASDVHASQPAGTESSAPVVAGQPAGYNAADVAFATDMIPHHQQAVAMSKLVPDHSTNPAVIKLAADISAAQGPEIETMKVFLVQWKEGGSDSGDGTDGTDGPQGNGDMGAAPMHGMVDQATMTKLETLNGAEFDQLWLNSMIGHHEGAIEMANTEIANGANTDAKQLAQEIVTGQQAEIVQMKQMLGG